MRALFGLVIGLTLIVVAVLTMLEEVADKLTRRYGGSDDE